jgi:hypothetical protein
MDKIQAAAQIESIFGKAFNRETYEHFLGNLLNEYEARGQHYSGNLIPHAFKQHVTQYWRVGKYVDPDHLEMDLLVVEVKSLFKLDRARTALRNFAVNRLRAFEKEYSLIAFYAKEDAGSDWRFSFIKIEPVAFQDEKGKVKTKKELTPAKRYSFLVGEHENSHTAQSQLLDILAMDYARPTIDEIEKSFSIEKVTKEFFNQYKDLFVLLVEHLQNQPHFKTDTNYPQNVHRFSKKLLGQIVFLYFLQKKGWLGVPVSKSWGNGDKRFLRNQLNAVLDKNGSFYTDSLQYLFYEALAKEREGQKEKGYYPRLDCKIPFLNGGLFEPDYDWKKTAIDIPNVIFTNQEKNKFGDYGTGILDVFDRYNFTIKEDEPLEKEVAVDPEMLGKVFENMLDVTERKSKGAFYTPREIVHYMCQESLIHFLDNALNEYQKKDSSVSVSEEPKESLFAREVQQTLFPRFGQQDKIRVPRKDIESLLRKGHLYLENDSLVIEKGKETAAHHFKMPDSVQKYAKRIDTLLAGIKICDPAIGSGAFPVGMLHEIVNTRQVLAPYTQNAQTAYDYKRHTIHESIYGVDVDTSAIDIARLRLWLSLVVDEEDYNAIQALPNLDYKIVQGNSLIGLDDRYRPAWLSTIETLKEEFYQCKDQKKKARLKEKINQKLYGHLKDSESAAGFHSKSATGYAVDFDFKLFFSEVWDKNAGFDIVIGNPPYVQIQNFSGQQIQKDLEKQNFETFAKTGDIYCLFYEKGYRLLKNGGGLCFITSNKWMRASYGDRLRKFFMEKTGISILIDFGDSPIFTEAVTYTNILLFLKTKSSIPESAWDMTKAYKTYRSLHQLLSDNPMGRILATEDSYVIASKEIAAIKNKIESVGKPLSRWDVDIYRGILTGFNEAFIVDGKNRDKLIQEDPKNETVLKPILRGRDIKRYHASFADLWLINAHNGYNKTPAVNLDDYPSLKSHLESIEQKRAAGELGQRAKKAKGLFKRDDQGITPYNLRNCAYLTTFEKEKIIYSEIVFDSAFHFDNKGFFPEATTFIMTGKSIKYLTALLNSRLLTFAFKMFYAGGDLRGDTFRYKKKFIQLLPIIRSESETKIILEKFIDYVQILKKCELKLQYSYFEQIIDGLVYELYFPDEVKKAKKEIKAHLGKLTSISDVMTDQEKLGVIQREFNRLYDPNHPVRNHIETLDSIPLVRTIQDALKR